MVIKTAENPELKTVTDSGNGLPPRSRIEFDYQYDGFYQLSLFFTTKFQTARPNVEIKWITPDGREIPMQSLTLRAQESYRISQDTRLPRRLNGAQPEKGLFADPENPDKVLKGTYRLVIGGLVFEPGSEIEASFVLYGKLHGFAGTDHVRRTSVWHCFGRSCCLVCRPGGSSGHLLDHYVPRCFCSLVWRLD